MQRFCGEHCVPTYAFLRLDVNHYSALLLPPPHTPRVPSLPSSASIHPLYPLHPKRCLSTGLLRLNKHITKLKYLQVPAYFDTAIVSVCQSMASGEMAISRQDVY